jgi:hypothetical protein
MGRDEENQKHCKIKSAYFLVGTKGLRMNLLLSSFG